MNRRAELVQMEQEIAEYRIRDWKLEPEEALTPERIATEEAKLAPVRATNYGPLWSLANKALRLAFALEREAYENQTSAAAHYETARNLRARLFDALTRESARPCESKWKVSCRKSGRQRALWCDSCKATEAIKEMEDGNQG